MKHIIPEAVNITQSKKSQSIVLNHSKKELEYNFKSKAYITFNGEIMNVTNPCADLEYTLLFDFQNNDYKFTKFKFGYDYDLCKKGEEETIIESMNNQEDKNKNSDNKVFYGLAAGLGAAGVASIPFILGALGGKKRNKTKRRKRKI
jgi:hypothetical protein